MGIPLAVSIVGVVLTTMIGLLGGFPNLFEGPELDPQEHIEVDAGTQLSVTEASGQFVNAYTGMIDYIISNQDNPDYEMAEWMFREFLEYGQDAIEEYQELEEELEKESEELDSQLEDLGKFGTESD